MDEYLNRINISFSPFWSKGLSRIRKSSSSSQPLLCWYHHSHTIPKGKLPLEGEFYWGLEKAKSNQALNTFRISTTFPKTWLPSVGKKSPYIQAEFQSCTLWLLLHAPHCASLRRDGSACPSLQPGGWSSPAPSCESCASAFTLLGALDCTYCSRTWSMQYWGAQKWSQDCRSSFRRREGTIPPCVLAALLPLQPMCCWPSSLKRQIADFQLL